ncbi:hypothetical protein SBA3_4660004 [Candidatus Sulfopaludibacter sp. SbA3]|nr:hypothetical protein SBA3_4660004 [Candidatus Sulfopaludibacter sp. SbA3]
MLVRLGERFHQNLRPAHDGAANILVRAGEQVAGGGAKQDLIGEHGRHAWHPREGLITAHLCAGRCTKQDGDVMNEIGFGVSLNDLILPTRYISPRTKNLPVTASFRAASSTREDESVPFLARFAPHVGVIQCTSGRS